MTCLRNCIWRGGGHHSGIHGPWDTYTCTLASWIHVVAVTAVPLTTLEP